MVSVKFYRFRKVFFFKCIFKNLFIYLFLALLGLRFCARAFCSCGERGPLLIAVSGPLTAAASPAAEHKLQTRRLSSCGSRAQSLRGMRDPPRPGLEPVSPAPAGRLPTTAPPGKLKFFFFNKEHLPETYSIINGESTEALWAMCINMSLLLFNIALRVLANFTRKEQINNRYKYLKWIM